MNSTNTTYHNNAPSRRLPFHHSDKIMGFEQLAALRDQLAAERASREASQGGKRGPSKNDDKGADRDKGDPHREHTTWKGPRHGEREMPRQPNPKPPRPTKAQQHAEAPRDPLLVAIGRLQHAFPKAFPKKPAPRVPLKLGIVDDLYAQAGRLRLSEDEIKAAVATWCGVARYWAALAKDAVRVDLNGEPAGTVTAAEAGHANFLARQQRKKAQAARKAASPQPGSKASEAQEEVPAADGEPAAELLAAPLPQAAISAPSGDLASV
jgi:ProP effector